ncbi:MAG: hypothetical protein SPJ13_03915 [Bacteroidales bacterium]|nr:hypothetical protein [Bacteroidales bacterium]
MDTNSLNNSRLRGLRTVLVLTFIGSGSMLLSHFFTGLLLPQMQAVYDSGALPVPEETTVAFETLLSRPRAYFLINAVLYSLSLAGAILMWRLKKNGFHYYAVAQLLLIVVALIFLGRIGVMVGDIMLSLLFIAFYYFSFRNLDSLKKNEQTSSSHNNQDEKPDNADF